MKLKLIAGYAAAALGCFIAPIEVRQRSWTRSPDMIDVRTGANAFAGRTTLSSGTAFVTISTQQITSDALITHGFIANAAASSGAAVPFGVSSIVAGVSFALGWIDQQGRAPTGVLMWEIKKTS